MFYLKISGNDDNEQHQENMQIIFTTLLVFHFEILGNDDNEEHPENI